MKRVLIIGSNGAGKSTFSYVLSEKTGLPLIHLDKIYWRDSWKVTPHEEFREKVLIEVQKPSWIIEGNNIKTLRDRLQYADTVFWFEFSPIVCVINIIKREIKYFKKARPDMPNGCISKIDTKFLRTAWKFNKKSRPKIEEALESAPNVKVIKFTNYRQVREYLK